MAFTAARTAPDSLSEMNITPLVDVMLVLLVIFMVTAPLMDFRLPVNLSHPTDQPPPPSDPVVLDVERGDLFRLAGEPVTAAALPQALRTLSEARPDLLLRIEVDPDADYQSAATALAAVDRAGIERFGLAD
ncbi:MAG TPA: biopolymer transporter ExbD [Arenimonas sp.]|uniref:ExbD/TolR family protein n=1 Tax=Arenimonas sp. TaxID=1872635 RepID=UPI002D7F6812|nr:biopolymer transporter ExbD [Arenimonas sp.]HEU0152178.1 biopolymer transporter ExbD [Arenimonas sp.]